MAAIASSSTAPLRALRMSLRRVAAGASRPAPPHAAPRRHGSGATTPRNAVASTSTAGGSVVDGMKSVLGQRENQFEGVQESGLRILIFGKPGSGKGTLSARLVQKYNLEFVASGDVLRREIMNKTEIGRSAEEIVAAGGLLPDELMLDMIMAELDKLHGKSWILDGFPRTLAQGEALDKRLTAQGRPFNMIVHLAVPDSVIMKRISARWVHLPSGRVYNTSFGSSAPKVAGKDDITGEPLSKRPDDNPETFSKRLATFHASTSPLLDYFSERYPNSLHSLEGATSDEVRLAATFSYHHAPEAKDLTSSSPLPSPSSSSSSPDANGEPGLARPPTDNVVGVEKIWPQLQKIIDPYHIERKPRSLTEGEVGQVRDEADDLKDQSK